MFFNSEEFMIFLPIVLLVYFILPKKIRYIWLLISSYYFYMCWNAKYAILLFTSTILTYTSALLIGKFEKTKLKKIVVATCIILNLGILFFFKYFNFAFDTVQSAFSLLNIQLNVPKIDVILPMGISFYIFQALSYTIDVYRGEVKPEKNVLKYALFVSFFPQLVAGPIERSKNLMKQLAEPKDFSFENAREGILLMIWGFFLKIVLADRTAVFVDTIFGDYASYTGWYIVIAAALFLVQVYCDFYGYSVIAMGTAKLMGINLMENFDAPFLSKTVGEFWRRWHISLTTWFKDYVYFPLGGSKKGKFRKHLNKLIVFGLSGLWHGANMTYVTWGLINGVYQIIGDELKPVRDKIVSVLHLNRESAGHVIIKTIVTFCLVAFSLIFFRAASMGDAFEMIKLMFSENNLWIFFDDSLYTCGLDRMNFTVMIVSLFILLFADIMKYRGIVIRDCIIKPDLWVRWLVVVVSIWLVALFGIWGPSYEAASFIYFQF